MEWGLESVRASCGSEHCGMTESWRKAGAESTCVHRHTLLLNSWFPLPSDNCWASVAECGKQDTWQQRSFSAEGAGCTTADMQQCWSLVESLTRGDGAGAIPFFLLLLILVSKGPCLSFVPSCYLVCTVILWRIFHIIFLPCPKNRFLTAFEVPFLCLFLAICALCLRPRCHPVPMIYLLRSSSAAFLHSCFQSSFLNTIDLPIGYQFPVLVKGTCPLNSWQWLTTQ